MSASSTARAPLLAALLAGVALAVACSAPASDPRYTPSAPPDETTFAPVAQMLGVRCGTIDCHGTPWRNLRIYSSGGLRYASTDRPFVPPCDTTDEVSQTYLSVIGLEPEAMSQVASGGDPGQLTLVRKPRGTEAHKGGQLWTQGDDADTCLTAWLAGNPSTSACSNAMAAVLPGGNADPLLQCLQGP